MPQIISSINFNPAALQADDLYIAVTPPPSYITGVPSGVAGVVGSASWGPLNTPVVLGSPSDLNRVFGGISAASLEDTFDLATDVTLAFMQSQSQASLQVVAIRVDNGAGVKAYGSLDDITAQSPQKVLKITAKYTGVLGNSISVVISAGPKTDTYNVTIQPFAGGMAERFVGLAEDTFWDDLIDVIANGQSGVRGPSQYVTAGYPTPPIATPLAPAIQTLTLADGDDGRDGLEIADLVGSNSANPYTGAYAFIGTQPVPSVFWLAGCIDDTVWSELLTIALQIGADLIVPFESGTTSAEAITAKKAGGFDDPNLILVKDDIYFFDSANGKVRMVPPSAVAGGRIAALSPEQSPSNKPVYGIVGTERNSPITGNIPYSVAEVGLLESNGILFISNPVPGGNYFGFRHGNSSSSDPVMTVIEYSRMTNFLALSFSSTMGKFVGQLQSTKANDPLRAAVRLAFNSFLQDLLDTAKIDGYQVQCDLSNNTFASIAAHYMYAFVKVRYLASVKYFVVSLQGGTTVVTIGNSLSEALNQ